ncbi:MAG TPA: beta-ketoacyl-ACP synthase III [Acidimicrobiales bacterium]|jgi:3-oxoacyl-[acyl-carrier-protein] synthase-3
MGIVIKGWGSALPEKVLTNADFEARLDTSDAWIVERTGIRERRWGGTTVGLSVESGQLALDSAGVEAGDIDLLLLATTTPDQQIPGSSASVQNLLGTKGGAVDLNAACSGFVYALIVGAGMCAVGSKRALVIGTDCMSRTVDPDDRGTAILFGDGSGAVVIEAVDGPGQLLGWDLGCDGSLRHLLDQDHGGFLQMNGKEVFRQAVRVAVDSSRKALDAAGLEAGDVSLFVAHQANTRIITSACEKLGIPADRVALVLERTGNTSAGSVPLALVDALDNGRIHDGDNLLLCGFGAGMTWASAVLRWGA